MEEYCPVVLSAAAAAKSLQSCLTLCDPIDGSPPGSPILGILQARTLEWAAIPCEREVAQSCLTLLDPMDCRGRTGPLCLWTSRLLHPEVELMSMAGAGQCRRRKSQWLIPGSGRFPGVRNLLQYSCLENAIDRGAWQATVHGVAQSQTQLSTAQHTQYYGSPTGKRFRQLTVPEAVPN